jgi:uncharacterized membrane protein
LIPFLLMAALLVALIVVVIAAGVRGGTVEPGWRADDPASRQEAALAQLAELEFEYQTGKINEEEYREMRGPLARVAVEARKQGSDPLEEDP